MRVYPIFRRTHISSAISPAMFRPSVLQRPKTPRQQQELVMLLEALFPRSGFGWAPYPNLWRLESHLIMAINR